MQIQTRDQGVRASGAAAQRRRPAEIGAGPRKEICQATYTQSDIDRSLHISFAHRPTYPMLGAYEVLIQHCP